MSRTRSGGMSSSYSPLVDEEAGWGDKSPSNSHAQDPAFSFASQQVRLGFTRKVFGLLSAQLAVTAFFVGLFTLHEPSKRFIFANPWTLWTSFAGSLIFIIAMGCSENLRRQWPQNLVCLGLFTLCESVMVGTVSALYAPQVVLLAAGITAGVVFGLTLFTMQTKFDLTPHSGALFSLFTALFVASIINIFVHAKMLTLLLCAGGVVIFSVYLVFDLQLVMGGHKYQLGADEYVFATLNLYLDIINIFLYILRLLNEAQRE